MSDFKDDFEKLSDEERRAYIDMHLATAIPEDRRENWITTGPPQGLWQVFAALLGLPVERKSRHIRHPFMILSFSVIMFLVFLRSYTMGIEEIAMEWGFTPSQFYKNYFLNIFTSFFLHGSFLHFFGNCYYFLVFGDDVEDDMDILSFIKLLFGGHLAGLLLHSILTGLSSTPMIGASAGVSALMGYYMVRFPKRQITYMVFFFYVWLHIPVYAAFLWKFGWEFLIASSSIGRVTGVAHWAHLGGALFGAYLAMKRLPDKRLSPLS